MRLSLLALAIVLAASGLAHAQPLPPDVVELTNGGMVRGTIIENLPGDHVTVQLPTGEMRTFAAAEVRSAGPAPIPSPPITTPVPLGAPILAQPGIAYAPVMAPRPTVSVHVEATSADLTLHEITGTATAYIPGRYGMHTIPVDQFAPLCTAPCDVRLEARAYRLGISQGQGQARRADHNLFTLDHDLSLELEYESREGARIAGWIIFIGGELAGLVTTLVPIFTNTSDFITPLIAGVVVISVSAIVGLALAFLNDHADIRTLDGSVHF
jgi:hypothetical protein